MKEYVVRLYPHSAFEGNLSSSTLFGALCWSIRVLYGEKTLEEEILSQFLQKPVFLISGLFPFRQPDSNDDVNYFFPKPICPLLRHESLQNIAQEFSEKFKPEKRMYHTEKFELARVLQEYKKFQKILLIPHNIFQSIAREDIRSAEDKLFREYLRGRLKIPDWKKEVGIQKNSIDRLLETTGGAGNTFYNREYFLRKGFGLFFLLKTDTPEKIKAALKFIEDSGIGPNSKTGKNHFKMIIEEKEMTDSTVRSSFITLSRFIQRKPFDVENSYYEIEFARHKVESRHEFSGEDIWKNAVPFIKEGSLITLNEPAEFPGEIFPVKKLKDKTIYQYGNAYPYWVNLSIKESVS